MSWEYSRKTRVQLPLIVALAVGALIFAFYAYVVSQHQNASWPAGPGQLHADSEALAVLQSQASNAVRAPECDGAAPTVPPGCVLVLSSKHVPVSGASLVAWTALGDRVDLEKTDTLGRAPFVKGERWSGIIRAYHESCGTGELLLKEDTSPEHVLVLEDGWTLRGRVRLPGGEPAPTDTEVMAVPNDQPFPKSKNDDSPWLRSVRGIETDGSFAIGALDPRGSYSIRAIASGYAMVDMVRSVTADSDPLDLRLVPLYGVLLRPQDQEGKQIEFAEGVEFETSQHASGTRILDSRIHLVPDASRWSRYWNIGELPDGCTAKLFTSDYDRAAAGPIECRLWVPGYEQATVQFDAPRWIGTPTVVPVELTATADRWSELVIRLSGGESVLSEHATRVVSPYQLHLSDARDHTLVSGLVFRAGEARVRVPAGTYDARFEIDELWRFPADGSTRLNLDDDTTWDVMQSTAASVRACIEVSAGRPYCGRAVFRFSPVGKARERFYCFVSAPYVFPAVSEGDWAITAMLGDEFTPPGHERLGAEFHVSAGEAMNVALRRR